MRFCYLVQSHTNPVQIGRLVATLGRQSPGSVIVVAHDSTGCRLERQDLPTACELHLLSVPGPMRRGYLSMLDPYFAGLEHLERERVDYGWVIYVSGQDYPTQPLAGFEARLTASGADGFLRYWPALSAEGPWQRRHQGKLRYFYQYRDVSAWAAPLLRLLRGTNSWQKLWHVHRVYGPRLGLRARRTPFEGGRQCYAGWQWTNLGRSCTEYLLEASRREPGLVDYYRRTLCPDESLVQTVLLNAGRFRLENDNLRYADNQGARDGRPRILGLADLETITAGGCAFARKFDLEHDARIFDALDQRIDSSTRG
ncbi:MAG TPA: beta-1,6-N-acetylglucosaminyltransferase [Thermoanaerobaculia bacterium]|nr:beta-1,6-N-acetylglucosaminyltransferase [Thermoanaerobaculia bacterium]